MIDTVLRPVDAPLALACGASTGLRTVSIIDERSAGFFALGHAKASGKPVALIATSGSASAHFYPAVIEAAMAHVPLVILSADRPPELQGWGAPQTVPQANLFGSFARAFESLGIPEPRDASLLHLRATVSSAVATASSAPMGAVQLNVPFREPLAPTSEAFGIEKLGALALHGREGQSFVQLVRPSREPDESLIQQVAAKLKTVERGIIVCGPRDASDDGFCEAIRSLSRATGYPVFAEASSQVRFGDGAVVSTYDAILRNEGFAKKHAPQLVLRFGGGLTSKLPQAWIDQSQAELIVFSDEGARFDPSHRATWIIEGNAASSARRLAQPILNRGAWAMAFGNAQGRALAALERHFVANDALSEPRIAREVVAVMPGDATLFVSSSMPIRDVDAFGHKGAPGLRVLANRGANGIDGIVSTALGAAKATGKPTVLLAGDLAFLHDLGALVTARRANVSLTIVVVNNQGGGIFSFLPIAEHGEHFEQFFGTPHEADLGHAAAVVGATYHRPETAPELIASVTSGLRGGLHVVEVRTSREKNVAIHRELFSVMSRSLGEFA